MQAGSIIGVKLTVSSAPLLPRTLSKELAIYKQ